MNFLKEKQKYLGRKKFYYCTTEQCRPKTSYATIVWQ